MHLKLIGLSYTLLFLIALNSTSFAQSPSDNLLSNTNTPYLPADYGAVTTNFVRTYNAKIPTKDEAYIINDNRQPKEVDQVTNYFDGLGRTLQTVEKGATPGEKDIVTPHVYDPYGRETNTFLPYFANDNSGKFKSDAFSVQATNLKTIYNQNNSTGEKFFYGKTDYEASPLSRITKTCGPGNSWSGSDQGISTSYELNNGDDAIRIWNIDYATGSLPTSPGIYTNAVLYRTTTTDEDGKKAIEFKDKDGHVVAKKVQDGTDITSTTYLITYYVYDDFGNLRFVIPPKATIYLSLASTPWSFGAGKLWSTSAEAQNLCFSYEYDERQRIIIKRVPGGGESSMVYDARDRLVFMQDPSMRSVSRWVYYQYDDFSREIFKGYKTSSSTRTSLQATVGTSSNYIDNTAMQLLVQTFYDDYEWLNNTNGTGTILSKTFLSKYVGSNYSYFLSPSDITSPYPQALKADYHVINLVTGTKTSVGGTGKSLYAVNFYDDHERLIQTQGTNYSRDDVAETQFPKDTVTTQYSYTGQVLRTLIGHKKGGTNQIATLVSTKNIYDDKGRLISIRKITNSSPEALIATMIYDNLGQLQEKRLGQERGNDFYTYTSSNLDRLKYEYNPRGWLRGINKDYARGVSGAQGWFGMELCYDYGFTSRLYNGNITGMRWRSKGDNEQRAYGYTYDNSNRLLVADFTQLIGTSTWGKTKMDFTTSNLLYDANGNIQSMKQEGMKLNSKSTIDNLTYNYGSNTNTNKLYYVKDANNDLQSTLGDFKESHPGTTQDYSYNANGNLTMDANKDISSITYNYMNLPLQITVTGKGIITYLYDNAGNKLKKVTVDNTQGSPVTTTTDYIGPFTYINDTLAYISHEEGRIRPKNNQQKDTIFYDYFEKDHLGNIRTVLTDEKKQDIYPVADLEGTNNGDALNVEKGYYHIVDANISDKPQGITNYKNKNGIIPNPNPSGDETANNQKMYKLNGSSPSTRTGLSFVAKVMTGDKIDIYAKSFYSTNQAINNSYTLSYDVALSTILTVFAGSGLVQSTHPGLTPTAIDNNPGSEGSLTSFLQSVPTPTGKPKAYINWVLLDEQMQVEMSSSGFEAIGDNGSVTTHSPSVQINKNGYICVYCSNESGTDVYFDNLQIVHNRGPLLEETHYYPFGLTMAGISSKALSFGNPENKKGFNGIEHTTDLDLNQYDAFYRTLDPQIGRFWQVDPQTELLENHSPYESMGNNPIINVDPLGDFETRFGAWLHSLWHGGQVRRNTFGEWYVSKRSASSSSDGTVTVTAKVSYGRGRNPYTKAAEKYQAKIDRRDYEDRMVRLGIYQRVSLEEARANIVGLAANVLLPNVLKPGTEAINSSKEAVQVESNIQKLNVRFGKVPDQVEHAFRHTDVMGLDRATVKAAIEEHLASVSSQIVDGKPFIQTIEVAGQKIQYTAYKLSGETINVGRIHAAD